MLKKVIFGLNFVVAVVFSVSGPASAIGYGSPALPETGSNTLGSFVLAGVLGLCGVAIVRLSSLRRLLRRSK